MCMRLCVCVYEPVSVSMCVYVPVCVCMSLCVCVVCVLFHVTMSIYRNSYFIHLFIHQT